MPACILLSACKLSRHSVEPSIVFTRIPPSGEGSPDKLNAIEGRVTGSSPGQSIVLFAQSGLWWVQPMGDRPFTAIHPDSTWKNMTHPGSAYAALLVNSGYRPPVTLKSLPTIGGDIVAVAVSRGSALPRSVPKTVRFSGYEWEVRESASNRSGTSNLYDAANVRMDSQGSLHLRLRKKDNEWTSAEVSLSRSLGYGSYRFVVGDISDLEPAAVFSIFTWDNTGPPREMDIEISRWGSRSGKNAQYLIQPYYVPANSVRFNAPPGVLTHTLDWQPGRVSFETLRGSGNRDLPVVDEHTFTSGVPTPGNEMIHMNLYRFDNKTNPLRRECEVVIEKFEFLP